MMIKTFTRNAALLLAIIGLSNVSFAQLTDLIISEYSEGSSYNKYIELYNGTGADIDLSDYQIWGGNNGKPWDAANFIQLTGTLAEGATYLIANDAADATILAVADLAASSFVPMNFNGDDAIGLAKSNGAGTFNLIDIIGEVESILNWSVAGTNEATKDHTLIRKETVCSPNTDWTISAGTSTTDSEWIVMAQDDWDNIGTHTATCGTGNPGNPAPPVTPVVPANTVSLISDINNVDADGVAESIGEKHTTKGVVLGVNMNAAGLSFTIFDGAEGMGVYSQSVVIDNYSVTEGDSITITGTVGQYNGLTQLSPVESITVINSGNVIPTPTVITSLTEDMESTLVTFENVYVHSVDAPNYVLASGNDTITMRIDSDTDVLTILNASSIEQGDSLCFVTGIVGQFDFSSPYTEGYQLFPRTYTDIDTTCGTVVTPPLSVNDVNDVNALSVYPNPNATGNVNFNKVISFTIYTITGKAIITKSNVNRLDVSNLQNGVYIIQTTDAEVVKLIIE